MPDEALCHELRKHLFRDPAKQVYAVLDGCQIEGLPTWLSSTESVATCLFDGPLDPILEAAAPQLVLLKPQQPITEAFLRDGWNRHWGVILQTPAGIGISSLRQHLRNILMVSLPGGRSALFRFYDPRAFKSVLPHLDHVQLNALFGPVSTWLVAGHTSGSVLCFEPGGGAKGHELTFNQ